MSTMTRTLSRSSAQAQGRYRKRHVINASLDDNPVGCLENQFLRIGA